MTTPTQAALRAARAVIDLYDPTACTQIEYEADVAGAALLIDEATALPDLLAVAERAALIPCPEVNGGMCSMVPVDPCLWCQARAALAKAKGN